MYSTRGLNFRGLSLRNVIEGNYWDDYQGFDFNDDNIGDSSYKKYLYLDQFWLIHPELRFFYGSPLFSMINFMLKLAPFMEPVFLIEDEKPIYNTTLY